MHMWVKHGFMLSMLFYNFLNLTTYQYALDIFPYHTDLPQSV